MESRCPRCGFEPPAGEAPPECPACGEPFAAAPPAVPFDNPRHDGFARALWQTWREATFFPNRFFARVPSSNAVNWPLVYAVLFGLLGAIANIIHQPIVRRMVANLPGAWRLRGEVLQTTPEFQVLNLVLSPFITLFTVLVLAAVFHGLLVLVGGARPEFSVTFRTVCYTYGTFVFVLLPVLGIVIHWGWRVVLLIIGLARAHQSETWRAAFAVLVPAVACCGAFLALSLYLAAALYQRLGL